MNFRNIFMLFATFHGPVRVNQRAICGLRAVHCPGPSYRVELHIELCNRHLYLYHGSKSNNVTECNIPGTSLGQVKAAYETDVQHHIHVQVSELGHTLHMRNYQRLTCTKSAPRHLKLPVLVYFRQNNFRIWENVSSYSMHLSSKRL